MQKQQHTAKVGAPGYTGIYSLHLLVSVSLPATAIPAIIQIMSLELYLKNK